MAGWIISPSGCGERLGEGRKRGQSGGRSQSPGMSGSTPLRPQCWKLTTESCGFATVQCPPGPHYVLLKVYPF